MKNEQILFANAWFSTHHANAVKYNTICSKTFVKDELARQQNPQNQQNSNDET